MNNDYAFEEKKYLAQTYGRQPILLVEGRGTIVKDSEGRRYIDLFSGIAVNNLGHCHPVVVKAIKEQAAKLIHTSNIYYTQPQIDLAKKLYLLTGGFKSFFCNSGAEANEAAIKLARKHTGRTEIITAVNSFHGRTYGALSATGQDRYKAAFKPLLPGFKHIPYGDIEALKKAVTKRTAALLLEPLQGEGGVIVPPRGYLREAAIHCMERGVLFILDEVQTGFGRTGSLFAWQDEDLIPDIFTVAKALGGGIPIGAMLAKEDVIRSFGPGDHASTFGGNPVACAAALASTSVIVDEELSNRAQILGGEIMERLQPLAEKYPIIKEVRGKGLLIGIELTIGCEELVDRAREKGLLLNCVHGNVIRLAPPLNIKEKEINKALKILKEVLSEADVE